MKDLWPSASRFWHLINQGQKRSKTQILTLSDPKSEVKTQNPYKARPQPPVERGWADKADSAHPSGGPVAGGAIGTSGMPLTARGRERPPDSDACKQAPRSRVS